jgi:hypothetical protein
MRITDKQREDIEAQLLDSFELSSIPPGAWKKAVLMLNETDELSPFWEMRVDSPTEFADELLKLALAEYRDIKSFEQAALALRETEDPTRANGTDGDQERMPTLDAVFKFMQASDGSMWDMLTTCFPDDKGSRYLRPAPTPEQADTYFWKDMPIKSPCGESCFRAIEAGYRLWHEVVSAVGEGYESDKVIELAVDAAQVFIFG